MPSLEIQEHVALAPYTTLGLGGPARWLIPCWDEQELIEAASWARQRELPMLVLGGGSNLVIPDAGFDGVVLHLRMQSLQVEMDSTGATITAEAGETWDELVRAAVERGLSGIECLSGIPGSTGATPMQNVGAYGQEVSETIQNVEVLEIRTLRKRTFSASDCKFGYRQSRFRRIDAGSYIVLRVVFRLPWAKNPPRIRYSGWSAISARPDRKPSHRREVQHFVPCAMRFSPCANGSRWWWTQRILTADRRGRFF